MKEIVEIADRYDVTASTEIRADLAPRDAILTEAKKRGHDLIVMGVSRPLGRQAVLRRHRRSCAGEVAGAHHVRRELTEDATNSMHSPYRFDRNAHGRPRPGHA